MTTKRKGVLWDIRDDRTLSEHAKIAYLMLWSRGEDIRPSLSTLAADMGASLNTAKRAVRELEAAGLLKRIHRMSPDGDSDTNRYELMPVIGRSSQALPPGLTGLTGGVSQAPKDSNWKTRSEGRKSQGSRRARPAETREEKITLTRIAVAEIYGDDEEQDLSDGKCEGLWGLLIGDCRPRNPVAYLSKIFTETPDLNTHLANCEPD